MLIDLRRSFIKWIKCDSPKTVPCGTKYLIDVVEDVIDAYQVNMIETRTWQPSPDSVGKISDFLVVTDGRSNNNPLSTIQ